MSAVLLKGKKVAQNLLKDLQERSSLVLEKRGSPPHLAILSIGGDPSSQIYLKHKLNACKNAGVECTVEALPQSIKEKDVLRILGKLDQDLNIDGIIVELPMPEHLDARRIIEAIPQEKDVEGVTSANFGKLFREKSFQQLKRADTLIPCTAIATIQLLLETGVDPRGLAAVIIGRSNIVGKPTAHLLSCLDATVTLCHSQTKDLPGLVRRADIVVSAVGKPRFIHGDWLKPGAIVLDAGVYSKGNEICGDVDFESARQVAGFITPVPGGIGPLTVTFLLYNTVISAEQRTRQILGD
ncbi:MAG: bifunctional 5,10-methylenetetrahydrofolate dehydrogenase/5,10-methenyltetrahydrofolate cyclohydrolase [Elusimicrobiota bacterium]